MEQIKEYEYVDLGLPSGLKWAKCNIGAETETDYGDYFMWGSTTPNTTSKCNWTNDLFNNGSTSYNKTYFNSVKDIVCPNGVLSKEYDAAAQIMGGDWRMPTDGEFQELLDNTTNSWITNYNGTGVNGRKFTSKTDESKYIFIPASGFRSGSSLIGQGSYGYVWSSSLYTDCPDFALNLRLCLNSIYASFNYYRYYGFAIRGVTNH